MSSFSRRNFLFASSGAAAESLLVPGIADAADDHDHFDHSGLVNYSDNYKLRLTYFRRKLGLLTLEEFCTCRDIHGKACRVTPRHGTTSVGVAR